MTTQNIQTATFASGCFWCTEAVFQKLEGVVTTIPGFMGGNLDNPTYQEVIHGNTGHAECIQIEFNPEKISYRDLVLVFFTTHDPTTLNRQDNDVGTQYRSAVFYHSEKQKEIAQQVIAELNDTHFDGKIITEITKASKFYKAESLQQDFYKNHRNNPYCRIIIDPKIEKLKANFSDRLKG